MYIDRAQLTDWRSAKPRMHTLSCEDPPPDDPKYVSDVRCEHDGLSLNSLTRRKISLSGYTILKSLYPSWEPPAWDVEECATCDALLHVTKQDKLVLRKQAEKEKVRLLMEHLGSIRLISSFSYYSSVSWG